MVRYGTGAYKRCVTFSSPGLSRGQPCNSVYLVLKFSVNSAQHSPLSSNSPPPINLELAQSTTYFARRRADARKD